jgi:erythritol transport system ATP-binding protein
MKVLSGVLLPTSGELILDGKPVEITSTVVARDLGISIIHQELSLAPNMTVRDNIFMGREITGPFGVKYAEQERQARALMLELEEDIDPLTPVENLRLWMNQHRRCPRPRWMCCSRSFTTLKRVVSASFTSHTIWKKR